MPIDLDKYDAFHKLILDAVLNATSAEDLERITSCCFGKNGQVSLFLKHLGQVPKMDRATHGKRINEVQSSIRNKISEKKKYFSISDHVEPNEFIDISLPSYRYSTGLVHPIHSVTSRIVDIFRSLGFKLAFGPHIETSKNNFDYLNIPDEHPSRDAHDTFYLFSGDLLRTHTSPVQVRAMLDKSLELPLQVISHGRVYRKESVDASHSCVFHQLEGLVVGKSISFMDLKVTLDCFLKQFFSGLNIRYRPSYFPFVEPGIEVDIQCNVCKTYDQSNFCSVCKNSKWVEILGAGMVHTNVFSAIQSSKSNLDNKYDLEGMSGFAFGLGIERILMILYQISDIRLLYENRLDFFHQFYS